MYFRLTNSPESPERLTKSEDYSEHLAFISIRRQRRKYPNRHFHTSKDKPVGKQSAILDVNNICMLTKYDMLNLCSNISIPTTYHIPRNPTFNPAPPSSVVGKFELACIILCYNFLFVSLFEICKFHLKFLKCIRILISQIEMLQFSFVILKLYLNFSKFQ